MLTSRGAKGAKAALTISLGRLLRRNGYDKDPQRLAREFKISAGEAQDLIAGRVDNFSLEQLQGMVEALS